MQLHGRRASALSVVALTSLALGIGTTAGSSATEATPSGHDARTAYQHLAKSKAKDYIKLDLLALNDFHGNLDTVPSTSSSGRINNTPAGGAAYLASLIRHERKSSRANGAKPLTVAAGDLIGASPLLSAAFHDEPTIKAMNEIGLDVASVGNHEFDEGYKELRRMQRGGCLDDGAGANGQDSCPGNQGFDGADFQYLSANVKWEDPSAHGRDTLFPATKIFKVKGVKVAFIGMTLEGTPAIVSQAGIQGLDFTDEVETANALVPKLRAKGVKSIVVLLHEGISPTDGTAYNDCSTPKEPAPALEIAKNLSPAIDAVVSGHTHQAYNCVVQDRRQPAPAHQRVVVRPHGDQAAPADRPEDPRHRAPGGVRAEHHRPQRRSVTPAQDLLDLIATYKTLVDPIANKVIGHIAPADQSGDQIKQAADADGGDSALGNLIADARRPTTRSSRTARLRSSR